MSARPAALQLNIKARTGQDWAKKDQIDPQDIIGRRGESGRKPGRPSIFNEEHAKYLENLVDEKPDATIADIMESLEISKSGLYKFMTEKCCVGIKQRRYHSVQRNSPEKLQKRFDWVTNW
jgi:transposase